LPGITIAVPVFNGGAFLAEALDSIRRQTCGDFCVVIFDNASTDDTQAIAEKVVAEDARFSYVRQSENKGALANFVDALHAAQTPYFLWRAIDDTWDDDYLEVLFKLLQAHPEADLAVGRISSTDLDGRHLRTIRFDVTSNRVMQVLRTHPSWIYGLFRREPLVARVDLVSSDYRHPWAWDHLTLFPFVIQQRIVGTTATTFHQVIRRSSRVARPRQRVLPDLSLMRELRQRFAAIALRDIAMLDVGPTLRRTLQMILPIYIGKRVYRLRRIFFRRLRGLLSGRTASLPVDERQGFERYY
jgi:glycosyltransferase involved in cell wall biosynthesis